MLSNFALVAGQVVTLFLLMGVGFVLAQLGKLYPDGVSQMSTLVLYVVTPCVIIHAFAIERTDGMVRLLLEFAAVYALSTLFCAAVALFCFRGEDPCRRGPMRFAMVYGNNGFMGLPLLLSILGEQAVIYGVVSVVVFNLLLWTHGVRTMGGRVTLRQALVSPATVGLAVGLPLFLTGGRLPSMVDSAVGFLADLNTPLAMIVIGAQMAFADLGATFRDRRLYLAAFLKLAAMPALTLLVLYPLGLDPVLYSALIILAATPTGGTASMFAQQFERDAVAGAQVVTLTTLFSILTLPAFVLLAKLAGGA